MASEGNQTISLGYNASGAGLSFTASTSFDASAADFNNNVSIGTSEETLAVGDIALPAKVFIKNTDATNFVDVGVATGVYTLRLPPLQAMFLIVRTGSVYLKADTGACICQVAVVKYS